MLCSCEDSCEVRISKGWSFYKVALVKVHVFALYKNILERTCLQTHHESLPTCVNYTKLIPPLLCVFHPFALSVVIIIQNFLLSF